MTMTMPMTMPMTDDRFFDCIHGYIYIIPEHNVYLHKCNVQEECNCYGCNNFISKIVKKE